VTPPSTLRERFPGGRVRVTAPPTLRERFPSTGGCGDAPHLSRNVGGPVTLAPAHPAGPHGRPPPGVCHTSPLARVEEV